jgi:2'-5' RNA ligase
LSIGYHAELSRATIAGLRAAAATVAMPPFRVALNRTMCFDRHPDQPFVLVGDEGIGGIEMFRERLVLALRGAGFKLLRIPSFTPHMTLFRHKCDLGDRFFDDIDWTVRDFMLIHSVHGESRHELLGRWPLRTEA